MKFLNNSFISANYLLVVIVVLAAVLRISFLDIFPKGLHSQEATVGWRAQNLINSGHDEFGRRFPIYFSNWTDIEMPMPSYLVLPFVAISKTSIFWLRLPFAISGILLVIGAVLLIQKLFPDKKNLANWVGFVLAVSPATVWFSRIVNPQIIAFCLIVWGVYLIQFKRWKILGAIIMGLSVFALAETFILVLGLFIIFVWQKRGFKQLFPIIFFLLCFLILAFFDKSFYISGLNNSFSLFKETSIIDDINLIRGHNLQQGLPNLLNSIFFNKAFFVILILKNFLSYFNLSYIFARGDGIYLNGLSNFGLMPLTLLPLFILGLFNVIKQRYQHGMLVLGWFILSTLTSLFIITAPDTGRFLFAMLPLSLLVGVGFINLNKVLKYLFLLMISFNILVICYDGLAKESIRQQDVFRSDTLELVNYINTQTEGDVWVTDTIDKNIGPKIAYLQQLTFESSNLKEDKVNIYRSRVKRIGNIYIGYKDQLKEDPKKFNFIIKAEKEDYFGCFLEKESFGSDENKYLILSKCKSSSENE